MKPISVLLACSALVFCIGLGACTSSTPPRGRNARNAGAMMKTESIDGSGAIGGPNTQAGPGGIGAGSNSGSGTGSMAPPGSAAAATTYTGGR